MKRQELEIFLIGESLLISDKPQELMRKLMQINQ